MSTPESFQSPHPHDPLARSWRRWSVAEDGGYLVEAFLGNDGDIASVLQGDTCRGCGRFGVDVFGENQSVRHEQGFDATLAGFVVDCGAV